jgi:carboxypeptidase PM20D1
MKGLAVAVTAIFAVLAGIVGGRAVLMAVPSAPTSPAPIPHSLDTDTIARHLAEAVRFETVSFGDGVKEQEKDDALDQMRAWMERTYPDFHRVARREQIGESLLFTWQGKYPDLAPVLLMAHMDVVPVVPGSEKDWAHAPFSGDLAEGFVWGRGAIDDKGSLVTILEAADALARTGFSPERTVMFAFGQDEEVGGGKGNAEIAKMLAGRNVHFAWVLDEGVPILNQPYPGVFQPVAFLATAEKGYLTLELTAHGNGGHSARPSTNLALPRLARALTAVMNRPFASDLDATQRAKLAVLAPYAHYPERLTLANLWLLKPLVIREMATVPDVAATLHTTISPTMMSAGVKENVLPPTARAVINFRLHPRDTIASVTQHVNDAIADPQVDVVARTETLSEASKVVSTDSPAYRFIAGVIRESFGVPVAPEMMTGATDSRHYLPIADAVLRMRPFHADTADLARVHGTNERVTVDGLAPAAAFYMRIMQELK